jgi:hypothetical protein
VGVEDAPALLEELTQLGVLEGKGETMDHDLAGSNADQGRANALQTWGIQHDHQGINASNGFISFGRFF